MDDTPCITSGSYSSTFKRGDLCCINRNIEFFADGTPLIVVEVMAPSEALRRLLAKGGLPKKKVEEYIKCVEVEIEDKNSSIVKVLYPNGSLQEFFDYELEHYQ